MNITILPLKGITINNSSSIMFGQTLDEVALIFNYEHTHLSNKYYLFDNNLCLEFDVENKLIFIEVSNCNTITPYLFGQNPFSLPDDELIPFLHKHCNCYEVMPLNFNKITDYIIQSESLSLFRQTSPYKILESIEDAKSIGYYNRNMDFDYLRSRFFDTIGIGKKDYFKQI